MRFKSFDNFRINHKLLVTWPRWPCYKQFMINQLFQYIGYMSVNEFAQSTVRSYPEADLEGDVQGVRPPKIRKAYMLHNVI
jgi:hypothetical protein